MKKINNTKYQIKIPFGLFGLNGAWQPNPHLKMPTSEQFMHNLNNGFFKSIKVKL